MEATGREKVYNMEDEENERKLKKWNKVKEKIV